MLRKCSAMCVAMVALVALLMTSGGRASASSSYQYLYVNAQLNTTLPTYIWTNCYQYQGQLGGDFYIGDTAGVNFVHGFPTVMTFSAGNQAHLEGIGVWNNQLATFAVDFNSDQSVSFVIFANGQMVWSSGFSVAGNNGMGYSWAGVYMSP